MTRATFDRYQDVYRGQVEHAIGFSRRGLDFYTQVKVDGLLDLASRRVGPPDELEMLDFGCGGGLTDNLLVGHCRGLHGVDVSSAMIEAARNLNPDVSYQAYDGRRLPFEDARFDVVFTICVLHHVAPAERRSLMSELGRVTRPGGLVVVFEHNPLNPLTQLVVARIPFDHDATLLRRGEAADLVRAAASEIVESRYILFFPWRARRLDRLQARLAALPFGAQYYVAGIRSA